MSAKERRRVSWIDYAKGIGIFSVTALHVLKGVIAAGLITGDAAMFIRDAWSVYSFNMPIFFFLGAMFLTNTVKKSWPRFFDDRLRTLFYPYLVWSLLTLLVGSLVAGYTNYGLTLTAESAISLLYDPVQHYWFLYAIFVTVTGWLFLAKLEAPKLLFFIITAVMWLLIQFHTGEMLYWIWGLMQYAVYFAAGALVNKPFRNWMQNTAAKNLATLSVVGLGIWGFFLSQGAESPLAVFHTVASVAGMLGVFGLCGLLDRANVLGVIEYWGLNSLSIYLAHVMAGAGFRIIMVHIFGIENGAFHLIGGILFAVYAPLLLQWLALRFNFPYIFVIPKAKAKPASPQSGTMATASSN